jgi:hypothetical protein
MKLIFHLLRGYMQTFHTSGPFHHNLPGFVLISIGIPTPYKFISLDTNTKQQMIAANYAELMPLADHLHDYQEDCDVEPVRLVHEHTN